MARHERQWKRAGHRLNQAGVVECSAVRQPIVQCGWSTHPAAACFSRGRKLPPALLPCQPLTHTQSQDPTIAALPRSRRQRLAAWRHGRSLRAGGGASGGTAGNFPRPPAAASGAAGQRVRPHLWGRQVRAGCFASGWKQQQSKVWAGCSMLAAAAGGLARVRLV